MKIILRKRVYVYASEGFIAGEIYNKATDLEIKSLLETNTQFNKLHILHKIIEYWENNWHIYFKNKKLPNLGEYSNGPKFYLKNDYQLMLKLKSPDFTLLGKIELKSINFLIGNLKDDFKYQKITTKGSNNIEFNIEIPNFEENSILVKMIGNEKIKIEYIQKEIINIKNKKLELYVKKGEINKKEIKERTIKFQISGQEIEYELDKKEDYVIHDNGFITVKLKKVEF